MTIARYSFLPWIRRGIGNQIKAPAAAASRASISVALTVSSDAASAPVPPRDVLLVGPGDVIGIHPHLAIRTEPRNWATDFEPNYLAFIEFYDEDLAWRYTPAGVDGGSHRLPPWLAVIVLKESEFKPINMPGRPLRSFALTPGLDPKTLFPHAAQAWAWSHVHVNDHLGDNHAPDLGTLESVLRRNPDTGYCRVICPRRLDPDTAYHAFVIPAFDVGRKAGLGLPVADVEAGIDVAWTTGTEFPIYHEWFFRTGAAGDFEELVRALKPRPMPKEVGIRDLDIHRPGFGMPLIVSPPDDLVGLEGALLSPFTVSKPLAPSSNFPPEIEKQVNLADDVAQVAPDSDPVVTAPLYGRWHALVNRISALPEHRNWVNELNRDPRFRAPAGMGTLVIQKNQEEYMKLAWQQIGEILAANRKIHFMQMAVRASQAAFEKHLTPLQDARALPILAPVFRKVMGSPVTVHHLVKESTLTRAAMSGAMRTQLRPRGLLARRVATNAQDRIALLADTVRQINDGTITAAPPRPAPAGPTLERAVERATPNVTDGLRWLIAHPWLALLLLVVAALLLVLVLPGLIAAVIVAVAVAGAVALYRRAEAVRATLDGAAALAPAALTPEAVATIPARPDFVLTAAGEDAVRAVSSSAADSIDARDFRIALAGFHALLQARVPALPVRAPIGLASVHETVMHALEPARAFPRRAATLLRVGDKTVLGHAGAYADVGFQPAFERIVPVMAYPDIKKPMYEPLRDISTDLFVPNLDLIPRNTISLMVQNQPFIEAYMVGLNHEFARELLWREYPTDQRPSTFRQFWDASNYVDREGLSPAALAEKIRDIVRIHEWSRHSQLGDHNNRDPHHHLQSRPADPDQRSVVLVIRGDLLKRYPNTVIYAQHAKWGDRPDNKLKLVLWDEKGEKSDADPTDLNLRFPLYKAKVAPDLHFVGFDLTLGEVRGAKTLDESAEAKASLSFDQLGWFFVIKEVVGEPRFGLDEHAPADPSPNKWDNLSWEHLGGAPVIDVTKPFVKPLTGANPENINWGANAADMAHILYQKPVMVAVHARDMLKELN